MFAEPVTEEELTNVFKLLKDSAAGYDGFNRTIISKIFQIILRSPVHIINLSLLSGVVPKEIKTFPLTTIKLFTTGHISWF